MGFIRKVTVSAIYLKSVLAFPTHPSPPPKKSHCSIVVISSHGVYNNQIIPKIFFWSFISLVWCISSKVIMPLILHKNITSIYIISD